MPYPSVWLPEWLTVSAWVRALGEGRDLLTDHDCPPTTPPLAAVAEGHAHGSPHLSVFGGMGGWRANGTVAHVELRFSSNSDLLRSQRDVIDGLGRLATLLAGLPVPAQRRPRIAARRSGMLPSSHACASTATHDIRRALRSPACDLDRRGRRTMCLAALARLAREGPGSWFDQMPALTAERLLHVVTSGLLQPDSWMGCYAGSAEDYQTLAPLFEALFGALGGRPVHAPPLPGGPQLMPHSGYDLRLLGVQEPLSIRVRVARSLDGLPLPSSMDRAGRLALEQRMIRLLCALGDGFPGAATPEPGQARCTVYSLTPHRAWAEATGGAATTNPHFISPSDRARLAASHLMFQDVTEDRFLSSAGAAADWPAGRGLVVVSIDGERLYGWCAGAGRGGPAAGAPLCLGNDAPPFPPSSPREGFPSHTTPPPHQPPHTTHPIHTRRYGEEDHLRLMSIEPHAHRLARAYRLLARGLRALGKRSNPARRSFPPHSPSDPSAVPRAGRRAPRGRGRTLCDAPLFRLHRLVPLKPRDRAARVGAASPARRLVGRRAAVRMGGARGRPRPLPPWVGRRDVAPPRRRRRRGHLREPHIQDGRAADGRAVSWRRRAAQHERE